MTKKIGRLEDRRIIVDGLPMYARVSTEPVPAGAPEVVLVHGYGVSSAYMVPTAERLAPFCRVYAPDLPGWGKSPKPDHVLGIPELADALAAWMEAASVGPAVLLGNSFGCQIIVEFALRHPARITQAILVGPTVDPSARTVPQLIWRLLKDALREPLIEDLITLRDYARFGPRLGVRVGWDMLRDPIEEKLPRIDVPTLVVRGGQDAIVSQAWAEEVASLLPDGRLVVIPDAAHVVNYSSPVALVEAVRRFLNVGRPWSAGTTALRDADHAAVELP